MSWDGYERILMVGKSFLWDRSVFSGIFLHLEDNGSISFGTDFAGAAYALAPSGWFHLAADFRFQQACSVFSSMECYSPRLPFRRLYLTSMTGPTTFRFSVSVKGGEDGNNSAKGGASHAVRAQSTNFGYSEGTLVSMGEFALQVITIVYGSGIFAFLVPLFPFSRGDHTLHYNDNGPANINYTASDGTSVTLETEDVNFSYPGDGWRTSVVVLRRATMICLKSILPLEPALPTK